MSAPYYGDYEQDPQDAAKEWRMREDDEATSDWFDAQAMAEPEPEVMPENESIN